MNHPLASQFLNHNSGLSLLRRGTFITLIFLISIASASCKTKATNIDPRADQNVTAEEVADQAKRLNGTEVTIRSLMLRKVGDNSFTVRDDRLDPKQEILVVNTSNKPFILPTEDDLMLQVTGEVKPFTITEIRQEYRLDLDPVLYAGYENKPVILAQSYALAPEPGQVTQSPERFYNTRIAVEGKVADILAPKTLKLNDERLFGDQDLLVVGVPVTESMQNQQVTVTGVLKPLIVAEVDTKYKLGWSSAIKQKLEAEYIETPIFVADAIYTTAQP